MSKHEFTYKLIDGLRVMSHIQEIEDVEDELEGAPS
jgi:hypothetical protein